MIELVVNNLRPSCPHRFIFVCQQAHLEKYDVASRLYELSPDCKIIGLPGVTSGAACSVLAASRWIDNDTPLMIANADQWINIDIDAYLSAMDSSQLDGMMMTMEASDEKWSYALFDEQGWVRKVIEKEVVSNEATVGIYNYRRGSDFCRLANKMIAQDDRSCGEFYVAPVYTEMYQSGLKRIGVYNIGRPGIEMHGLGTPADLSAFLDSPYLNLALTKAEAAA